MVEVKKIVKNSKAVSDQVKAKKKPVTNLSQKSRLKAETTEKIPKDNNLEDSKNISVAETAKAGKRSAKAIKEAEFKYDKEAKKLDNSSDQKTEISEIKKTHTPTTFRLDRRSKSYKKVYE